MVTIIKLGGSYITDKERPEAIREDRLRSIAEELRLIKDYKIIVHGGGSFGHYYAKKYGYTNSVGLSKTRLAMMRLSMAVAKHLEDYNPVIFPGGSHFIIREVNGKLEPTPVNFYPIKITLYNGNLPITYGDVTLLLSRDSRKYVVISGDQIAYALSVYTEFRYTSRVIMISDMDAIYVRKGGPRIRTIRTSELSYIDEDGNEGSINEIQFRDVGDVTGGMREKFRRALRIAMRGVEVIITNSIRNAIEGKGTRIIF